jgi:hypothetical protein
MVADLQPQFSNQPTERRNIMNPDDYQPPIHTDPTGAQYKWDGAAWQPLPAASVKNRHESLAVASLVLGILAVVFSLIPFIGLFIALPLGILALVFGLVGHRPLKGKFGVGLGVVGLAVTIIVTSAAANDVNKVLNPDTNSAVHTVVYSIGGESMDDGSGLSLTPGADVTYGTASGQTQQQGVDIPWTDTETMGYGGIPIILAQNTAAGTITCTITVDGIAVARNEATGEFAIAQCNGDML